jgi:hypothetical protein
MFQIKKHEEIKYECRYEDCKDLIKPGKKIALTIDRGDPIYYKGINITVLSLNDIEFHPQDRWIQVKGSIK